MTLHRRIARLERSLLRPAGLMASDHDLADLGLSLQTRRALLAAIRNLEAATDQASCSRQYTLTQLQAHLPPEARAEIAEKLDRSTRH